MHPFASGLLVGWLTSLIVATAIGLWGYRRILRLQRRAQQAERLAELGTLTGGLAHEIKNPLSTVQLNLQLLAEDLIPENPAYGRLIHRLNTVQREAARLKDTLDDFLRYAGKIELNRRPTDLNDLLEELVDFFYPQAQLQRIQLRLRKANAPVIAEVDPKLIKQAVLNLMINATHAMPNGGDLMLSVATRDGHATIDVIDTGEGIPQDSIDKIFQAYFSTKKSGTGLGLPMTKRLIEEHNGHLAVRSEPGKGSAFTIQLPLK